MSGTWQPPDPGAVPPPPPGSGGGFEPPIVPLEPAPGAEAAPNGGRSRGKVIAAVVGAVAIIGAGVFAITRIAGDEASAGGAESPEDAANAFLDAIDQEDVLGIVDVLLPGEQETFRQPIQDLASELKRLEVVSDDSLGDISGFDISITDRDVQVEQTNIPDIVDLAITAKVGGSIDGAQLPIGDWIRDNVGDEQLAELDEQATPEESDLQLAAVRQDGRWYISVFYSIAEQARRDAGIAEIPAGTVALNGGDSPQDAVDKLLAYTANLDLAWMIGALNPNEFEALQRYAPLFLDDAQADVDSGTVSIDLGDTEYDVRGSGDRRSVLVKKLTFTVTADGEEMTVNVDDGCVTVKAADNETHTCAGEPPELSDLDEIFGSTEAADRVRELLSSFQDAIGDAESPGIVVQKVDGSWYVSPIATATDALLALSGAFTRDELESLWEQAQELVQWFEEQAPDEFSQLDDYDLAPDDTSPAPVEPGTGDVEEGSTKATTATSVAENPTGACFDEDDATAAAACFQGLVTAGEIDAFEVPWYLAHPECGAADAAWTGAYFSLPDADFVAFVGEIAPCFQDLVANGTVEDYVLPPELLKPECLDGRNWYTAADDQAYLDAFQACAYG